MRAPESEEEHIAERTGQGRTREELEKTLAEARSSEAWLRKIIDTIPTPAYCNLPDGTNEFSNKRWQDYTGLTSEESSGWGWQAAFHPEDLARTMDTWRALLAAGEPGDNQARLRRHDGVYRWFLFRCEPLYDETGKIVRWYGIATDVDDLKRTEEKLRDEERELRQITDAIAQTLGVLDPSGAMLYANQATLDYTGLTAEDLLSPNFRERIFHLDDLVRLRQERKAALESGLPFEIEQRALRKDGQYRWFLIRYNPFRDEQGRLLRWYVAGTDIEDLKRTESLLKAERDRLRLLLEIEQALVANLDLKSLFESLAATLREVTGCDLIGLSLPDPAHGQLRQRMVNYREGRGAIKVGLVVPLYGSASGKAFRTRELVYMDGSQGNKPNPEIYDTPEGKRFYQLLLTEGVPSGYFLPLVHKGEAIAVLQLTKYAGVKFKTQQADFLKALAGQLSIAVANALEHDAIVASRDQLVREQIYLREEIERNSMFEEIVGSSVALRRVLGQVSKVAPTDSTVLILGETGTGKELLARAIHNRSRRLKKAFIQVNCAAIPQSLIASELFGHEKGSFTGALQRRVGRFELADGGTLFLDEVGELPPETQIALLRVLQEREFERVGGSQTIAVDVRVIAATNRDLDAAIADGAFRRDLFYRLNVFPIRVPPLRERIGDISLLVGYLIDRYAQRAGKKIPHMERRTMDLLCAYDWPGNVRELQNVIERAVILCEGETFSVDEAWLTRATPKSAAKSVPLVADLVEREKEMIEKALRDSEGVIGGPGGAASKLGVPRQTLESKIRKLGINRYRYKTS
jgi:formate hydrogenlyase transcriptional activator